jgi:hypothetical protein
MKERRRDDGVGTRRDVCEQIHERFVKGRRIDV